MATSSFLLIPAVALLICPALSLTCTSQTFSHNTTFANCTDLPTLNAFLHWTYDPTAKPKPTLSIAFIAPPAKSDGWIAWALNPTASGMLGAQSLIAFKDTNGSVVVKTYNVSVYGPISESKISYEVLNKRAESSDGVMRIFATLALPSGSAEVNQVWQVGASVKDGVPAKHDFSAENLGAKSKLQLVGQAAEKGGSPAAAPTAVPVAGGPSGNQSGGSSRVWGIGLGLYGALVVLSVSIFGL